MSRGRTSVDRAATPLVAVGIVGVIVVGHFIEFHFETTLRILNRSGTIHPTNLSPVAFTFAHVSSVMVSGGNSPTNAGICWKSYIVFQSIVSCLIVHYVRRRSPIIFQSYRLAQVCEIHCISGSRQRHIAEANTQDFKAATKLFSPIHCEVHPQTTNVVGYSKVGICSSVSPSLHNSGLLTSSIVSLPNIRVVPEKSLLCSVHHSSNYDIWSLIFH